MHTVVICRKYSHLNELARYRSWHLAFQPLKAAVRTALSGAARDWIMKEDWAVATSEASRQALKLNLAVCSVCAFLI